MQILSVPHTSAMDDGCNQAERDPNSSIRKYTLKTGEKLGYQHHVWFLNCDDSQQILMKTYLKEEYSWATTSSVYNDASVYSNGERIGSYNMWAGTQKITAETPLYKLLRYTSKTGLPFSKPIIFAMDSANSVWLFPENKTGAGGTFTVTGSWYDPAYNGSGYNVVEAPNGLVVYFYGYKSGVDGQAQWLTSDIGSATITKGQSMQLKMYSATVGNGGSFTTKPSVGSGISEWGTATITFNSCNAGTIVLDGNDGKITHNIVKLANIKHISCAE